MKPLTLKMTAFLGFKEETSIDFRPLYEDKIFLITGPTGSGKTSIFDAVAYALYGEGSGETRSKAKCFRSHLAGEKENMEVELEFEVRGEFYHVRRVETAKGVNKAYFYKANDPETLWTKIREVNQEIEEIIGLNLDQFKKIVMIPQGEFREFLTASTKDKSDIMKKLFSTEQYEVFQRKIKESFDGVVGRDKDLVRRFTQITQDVGIDGQDIEQGPDALLETLTKEEELVKSLKNAETLGQLHVKTLEKEVEKAVVNNEELMKFQKIKEEYLALESQKTIVEEKQILLTLLRKVSKVAAYERQVLSKEKELQKNETELKQLGQEKEKLAVDLKASEEILSLVKEEERLLDGKKEKRNELKQWIIKSQRLKEINKELIVVIKRGEILEQNLNALKVSKLEIENLRKKERILMEYSHDASEARSNVLMDLSKNDALLKTYRILYQKHEKKEKLELSIAKLTDQGKSLGVELQEKTKKFRIEEEKRNNNYALLLRENLKQDEPCPVCGSLHHPLNIDLSASENGENLVQIDKERKELEKQVQNNISQLKYEKQGEKDLSEEIKNLYEENELVISDFQVLKAAGLKEKKTNEELRLELERKEKIIENLKKEVNEINSKIANLEKTLVDEEALTQAKFEIDEKKNDLKGELRTLENEGVTSDFDKMHTEVLKLDTEIRSIEIQLKDAEESFEQVQKKVQNLIGNENALEKAKIQVQHAVVELKGEFIKALKDIQLEKEVYERNRDNIGEIDILEEETTLFNRNYYEKKGIYASLKEDGEKRIYQDIEPLKENLDEAHQNLKVKQNQLHDKTIQVYNLNVAHERLGETYTDYMENKKDLVVLQSLYDTANLGMGFETFVQSYYFEGILIRANQRLNKMSEGRYQLRRRNETENRREKIGLGLNVFDEYSGQERDVMSLSGGESFKASLSLALGLSDFIESHKGSVNLGTIFIDEGFGSLDQDSLDNALECLLELNLSGRIVGIISHVTELKDRIPGRIEVTSKPGQGSKVVVNGGIK